MEVQHEPALTTTVLFGRTYYPATTDEAAFFADVRKCFLRDLDLLMLITVLDAVFIPSLTYALYRAVRMRLVGERLVDVSVYLLCLAPALAALAVHTGTIATTVRLMKRRRKGMAKEIRGRGSVGVAPYSAIVFTFARRMRYSRIALAGVGVLAALACSLATPADLRILLGPDDILTVEVVVLAVLALRVWATSVERRAAV